MNKPTSDKSYLFDIFKLLVLFIYTIFILLLYSKNPYHIVTNYASVVMMITLFSSIFLFNINMIFEDRINLNFDIFKYSFLLILFLIMVIYFCINNPGGYILTYFYMPLSIFLFTCGLLILAYLLLYIFSKNENTNDLSNTIKDSRNLISGIMQYFLFFTLGITISISFINWFIHYITTISSVSGFVKFFINIFILIIIFALIYRILIRTSFYENSQLVQLIVNSIFYIPCLLVSFFDNIVKLFGGKESIEKSNLFKPTTSEYILLIIAVVLNLMYFSYPYFAKKIAIQGGKLLLNKPIYTNKETGLGSYQSLNNSNNSNVDSFDYNYAISFWVFLNASNPSTHYSSNHYTSILNYGNKPNILYNASENALQIIMDNKIVYRKPGILLQKWNNIIINYNGGTLDVFYNGNLEKSVNEIVPYMSYDTLTVGENNGVEGGICNVIYFNHLLNVRQIYYLYNFVKDNTPPIYSDTEEKIKL